jgi:uncharacterized protein (TIGR03067 family)
MLAVLAGVLVAADDATVKSDREALQGKWLVVASEARGKKDSDDKLKEAKPTFHFQEEKLGWSFVRDGKEITGNGSYKLDPSTKPKSIDLTGFPESGKTFPGIYEMDGDTLKICFDENERPKEFASKAGSRIGLLTLRKQKE